MSDKRPRAGNAVAAALAAVFVIWLAPRRTLRHSQHVPLWAAWLAHLLVVLIAVGVIAVGVSFMDAASAPLGLNAGLAVLTGLVINDIHEGLPELWDQAPQSRYWMMIALVSLFWLELEFLAVAVALVSWSAQDEPLRQTCRHALLTTWLWTGAALPFLVLLFSVLVQLRRYERVRAWTLSAAGLHDLRYDGFWWDLRDWLAANGEDVIAVVTVMLVAWLLFILLRAAATKRESPAHDRPPICESCGYNLSHTPTDSRCPECGVAVRESIEPGLRQPNAWEHAQGLPPLSALIRCSLEATFRPGQFFRTMPTRQGLSRARTFLVLQFILSLLVSPVLGFWMTTWGGEMQSDAIVPLTCVSLFFALLALWWLLTTASLVGIACRWIWKQNVMPGVLKVFCYTYAPFLALAISCGAMWGPLIGLAVAADRWSWRIGPVYAFHVIVVIGLAITVLCPLIYLFVALRGVRQIRYANS